MSRSQIVSRTNSKKPQRELDGNGMDGRRARLSFWSRVTSLAAVRALELGQASLQQIRTGEASDTRKEEAVGSAPLVCGRTVQWQ